MERRSLTSLRYDTAFDAIEPGVYYGTGWGHESQVIESGVIYFQPFLISSRILLDRMFVQLDSAGDGMMRIGIYRDDFAKPNQLMKDIGEIDVSRVGNRTPTFNEALEFSPGLYWLALGFVGPTAPAVMSSLPLPLYRTHGNPNQMLWGHMGLCADYDGGNLPPEVIPYRRSKFCPAFAISFK